MNSFEKAYESFKFSTRKRALISESRHGIREFGKVCYRKLKSLEKRIEKLEPKKKVKIKQVALPEDIRNSFDKILLKQKFPYLTGKRDKKGKRIIEWRYYEP